MGSSKMDSTQFGLVLNFLTGSISGQYHVLFDEILSTVIINTATDIEFWIRLGASSNSSIHVVLYQENDPEFYGQWLTSD